MLGPTTTFSLRAARFGLLGGDEEDYTNQAISDRADDLLNIKYPDFALAPIKNPGRFCMDIKMNATPESGSKVMDFYKGTTTLGFVFNEDIIIAVDSRASMGSFIGSGKVRKVLEINDYLLGTMAGGAADCVYWENHLARICRLYELRNGKRISVAGASSLLANIFFNYRGYGLSCGTMIAGIDHTGPCLYCVDDNALRAKGRIFSYGSGSVYAYGIIDKYVRDDMTLDEAVELGKKAICIAGHNDGGSGNTITVYHVHKNGWTCVVDQEDLSEYWHHLQQKKGVLLDPLP